MLQFKSTPYDLENKIMYDLCANHFRHTTAEVILAKTLIIGRTYAASLDRGKSKNRETNKKIMINDDFYLKKVVPLFLKSNIDERIARLKKYKSPSNHVREILALHLFLTKRLGRINQQVKRSFCSKYLHFHLPNLFFLYDSRAQSAINKLISKREIQPYQYKRSDKIYSTFFNQCLMLQERMNSEHKDHFTPRHIDNYLLSIANMALRKKKKKD